MVSLVSALSSLSGATDNFFRHMPADGEQALLRHSPDCLAYSLILKMEEIHSSEMSVNI
jgi:hypothetical protein